LNITPLYLGGPFFCGHSVYYIVSLVLDVGTSLVDHEKYNWPHRRAAHIDSTCVVVTGLKLSVWSLVANHIS